MNTPKSIMQLIEPPRAHSSESIKVVSDETVDIRSSNLKQFNLSAQKYRYIDISDSKIINLEANNVISFRGIIQRCHVEKSRLTGLQLPESNIKNTIFKNCRLNLTNFRGVNFECCIFIDCDLIDAGFAMAKFTQVEFLNCQLENVDFSNIAVKRPEFKNSSLATVQGVSSLARLTISHNNLIEITPLLASSLNIKVV